MVEGTGSAELFAVVQNTISDLTGKELVESDLVHTFEELGLDSLVLVEVICEIEDHLGAELDEALLQRMMECESLSQVLAVYETSTAA